MSSSEGLSSGLGSICTVRVYVPCGVEVAGQRYVWLDGVMTQKRHVVAVGNPCRVMREVGERDRKYYFKDREIDPDEWKTAE